MARRYRWPSDTIERLNLALSRVVDVACGNCRHVDNTKCNTCLIENMDTIRVTAGQCDPEDLEDDDDD